MRSSFIIWLLWFFSFNSEAQSYELIHNSKDTINLLDRHQLKQGLWIMTGKNIPGKCFATDQKTEEGYYKNNKKIGIWLNYHCNGNIKSEITFVDGRPEGHVIIYFENGNLSEDGFWKDNRWVGNLKIYNKEGDCTVIKFDENGKQISKSKAQSTKPVYSDPRKKN